MINALQPLKFRLKAEQERLKIAWNILEQDYMLSWVLYGISNVEELRTNLVFKGGTALKKCYFGEYRFSEDLDFSYVGCQSSAESLEKLLTQACAVARKEIEQYILAPIKIEIKRYIEKQPHPEGQLAFVIKTQLPWHREPIVKIMVEITLKEDVILPPLEKKIIHLYGENIDKSIKVYGLEEIIAEKLRAILQYTKKLHEHGWARSRVRDYYDLWSIFNKFQAGIDNDIILSVLKKKCLKKGVSFTNKKDFFQSITLNEAKKGWGQWLEPLVISPPKFDDMIFDLEGKLQSIGF